MSYLFAATVAVWLGVVVFLLRLDRRSRELEDEVQELKRQRGL